MGPERFRAEEPHVRSVARARTWGRRESGRSAPQGLASNGNDLDFIRRDTGATGEQENSAMSLVFVLTTRGPPVETAAPRPGCHPEACQPSLSLAGKEGGTISQGST